MIDVWPKSAGWMYLIWDFDGTLGYRDGGWSKACVDVVRNASVCCDISVEDIRPHLQDGFPWHRPSKPHTDITTADDWWEELYPVFRKSFEANGIETADAVALSREVRRTYVECDWNVFDDVDPALSDLSSSGWSHVVLSNHVPELPSIIGHLELDDHFEEVYTSAAVGYEKPHPAAFELVVSTLEDESTVWMIGDSYRADVKGAATVDIPAILVRNNHPGVEWVCESLASVGQIVDES